MMAKCDGPNCQSVANADTPKHPKPQYPDSWTVIRVERSRIMGLSATTDYGFCSSDCLYLWAGTFHDGSSAVRPVF
jgi:hypothetical protein